MPQGIAARIKWHYDNKKYCNIFRRFSKNSKGYIVAYSEHFVLLQQAGEFVLDGYVIFPVESIIALRYNNNDK